MEITKRKLTDSVFENLKKVHGNHSPFTIIKKLCTELLSEAENKLKASWNPPPYDPALLAPLRNILLIEKEDVDEKEMILEPITVETFNLYYSKRHLSLQQLKMKIAKEIVYTFFSPAKKIYYARVREKDHNASSEIEELSNSGAVELLMPEEHFKEEMKYLGFNPLACNDLCKMFDVSRFVVLNRMAKMAPYPSSIAILEYHKPLHNKTEDNELLDNDESIPHLNKIDKFNFRKMGRYRVVFSINSPEFHYSIPLNKSMPPDTIFYHSAFFNKPLSGYQQLKIDMKKVKFEIDVMPVTRTNKKETFPSLLAFFKLIQN